MSNSAKHIQQVLRDILWRPEAIAGATPQQGKDVAGGRGSYWYGDGSSSDGDKEPPKDGGKGGGKDGGGGGKENGNGQNGGDNGDDGDDDKNGGLDPSKQPDPGDDGSVIEPLYDCGTGQCVKVVLNPAMASIPTGWGSPCAIGEMDDQEKGFFAYSARLGEVINAWTSETKTVRTVKGETRSGAEAYAQIASVIGGHKESPSFLESAARAIREKGSGSGGGQLSHGGILGIGEYSGGYSVSWHSCEHPWYRERKICQEPPQTELPKGECFQIMANGDTFEPACDYKDLPAHLQGKGYTSFTLCDKNGNPVTVSRDGQGWTIDHPDYTATVGADFKVSHVVKKIK